MFPKDKKYKPKDFSQDDSDELLINKYRETTSPEIVGELFKRYTHLVFGVCMKYLKNEEDSRDAVMEIFENLYNDLKKHDIRNFKNWLYMVSRNFCMMKYRKDKTESQLKEGIKINYEEEIMESLNEIHHYKEGAFNEKINNLQQAIKLLNNKQGRCIELMYFQQKSYKEVAQITGFSLNEVKSYIQNAKRNLKIYLTDNKNTQTDQFL